MLRTSPDLTLLPFESAAKGSKSRSCLPGGTVTTVAGAKQALEALDRAHQDPATAGRFHGQVATEAAIGSLPPWTSVGKWMVRSARAEEITNAGRQTIRLGEKAADALDDASIGRVPTRKSVARAWHPAHTRPTGTKGGVPGGTPETVKVRFNAEKKRSIQRQNESAELLAAEGYKVVHGPAKPPHNPDLLVEGRIFDVYSPSTRPLSGIQGELVKKIKGDQARRFVVNLDDSRFTIDDVRRQFADWPKENLEEVIAIKNKTIEHIYP